MFFMTNTWLLNLMDCIIVWVVSNNCIFGWVGMLCVLKHVKVPYFWGM